MIMAQIGTLIDPKKKAEILQRIKDRKAPFCAEKPAPETPELNSDHFEQAKLNRLQRTEDDIKKLDEQFIDAAARGDISKVEELWFKGADVNARDNMGGTALMMACALGSLSTAEILLTRGATIKTTDNYRKTPLDFACINGYTEIARLLIENGADVNTVDDDGYSILWRTRNRGNRAMIELLTNAGAKE